MSSPINEPGDTWARLVALAKTVAGYIFNGKGRDDSEVKTSPHDRREVERLEAMLDRTLPARPLRFDICPPTEEHVRAAAEVLVADIGDAGLEALVEGMTSGAHAAEGLRTFSRRLAVSLNAAQVRTTRAVMKDDVDEFTRRLAEKLKVVTVYENEPFEYPFHDHPNSSNAMGVLYTAIDHTISGGRGLK